MNPSSVSAPVLPTVDENLLLSDAIEFNWKNNPSQPFYVFSDPDNGSQVITHLEFGRAAHRMAHLLRPQSTGNDGDVIGIMAHTDTILSQAVAAGLIVAGLVLKCGMPPLQPFPVSLRIPPDAIAELLIKASCRRVLVTTNALLKPLLEATKINLEKLGRELEFIEMPSLDAAYPQLAHEDVDFPFEPYQILRRPSITDTCIIFHSSGSTGFPKAIAQSHQFWVNTIASPEFKEHNPRLTLGCMALPAFNPFSTGLQLFHPAFTVVPIAVYPPTTLKSGLPVVPTPQNIIEHAKATRSNSLFVVPILIQAWSHSPQIIEYLKGLEFVAYAGLRLLPKLGNQLTAAGVRLDAIYGGTEFGAPASLLPNANESDWEYVRFFDHVDVRWIPQGDDIFECQFLTCKTFHPSICNLPDVEGLATGDIFKRHPTDEGLWKHVGRIQEIIVHSSGKKTMPGPIEDVIVTDPLVQAALVIGHGRDRTGVVLEVKPDAHVEEGDEAALSHLRDQIWPTIEQANREAPDFSKISKETIIFTSKGKPLPRNDKGLVKRHLALEVYAPEIERLFESIN